MPGTRNLRYCVATSLDGFIAGSQGEADWIVNDPEIDFAALWAQSDTLLMGRRTFDAARRRLGASAFEGKRTVVASRSLNPADHPHLTIVTDLQKETLQTLRTQAKKDIWLMGGGDLFSTVLQLGEVDVVNVTIIPVLLGAGVPLSRELASPAKLTLLSHKTYPSGIVRLEYAVRH